MKKEHTRVLLYFSATIDLVAKFILSQNLV